MADGGIGGGEGLVIRWLHLQISRNVSLLNDPFTRWCRGRGYNEVEQPEEHGEGEMATLAMARPFTPCGLKKDSTATRERGLRKHNG